VVGEPISRAAPLLRETEIGQKIVGTKKMLTRKKAIPLIKKTIAQNTWLAYFGPHGSLMIAGSLIKACEFDADVFDRMGGIASLVSQVLKEAPVELVNVPTHDNAEMGQIECIITKPFKVAISIIYYQDDFWALDRELFPSI
jgi:hypothetical protein